MTLKNLIYLLTLIIHAVVIGTMKLVNDYGLIMTIIIGSIFLGLAIRLGTKAKESYRNQIGLGILFGSLTSLSVVIVLTIYLAVSIGR